MSSQPNIKAQLAEAGLQPKRHFGQNFLADASICSKIAELSAPSGTSFVVEIGAGLGALTGGLLERASTVVAIERDRDLIPQLQASFCEAIAAGRLNLVEEDAKAFDYAAAFSQASRPATLAGNLPYQITGPLLRRCLDVSNLVERCCFLVQLEVAERLTAKPGTDNYGALTVFVQARYAAQRSLVVRRGAFYPQPNVDSAVVVLLPLDRPIAQETPAFRALVKSAFGQRRKTLRNAWSSVANLTTEQLTVAAADADIDLGLRGEVLSVAQFAKMAAILDKASAQVVA